MPQGIVKPTNRILASTIGAETREYEVGANATAAKMLPGIAVIYDTVDYAVKEAGAAADNILGVLEASPTMTVSSTPGSSDHYAVGDQCTVIKKGQCKLILASGGAAVAPGDPIVTAADGKFTKQAVGALGAQGAPVAYAVESANPAVADAWCLVEYTGGREAAAAA